MKLVKPEPVVKATVELGYAETVILPLGVVLLACTILYLIPRTAVLGAILLTGYLGGAIADSSARRARTVRNLVSRRGRRSAMREDLCCAMTGCAHSFLCEISSHGGRGSIGGSCKKENT